MLPQNPAQRLRIALAALALAGAASCGGAAVHPPSTPAGEVRDPAFVPTSRAAWTLGGGTSEVAFHRGLVWLRGGRGWLLIIDPEHDTLARTLVKERVIDIHRTLDDKLWILSATDHDVHLWERVDGGLKPLLQMEAPSSPMLAVADAQGRPVLLARRSVFVADKGGALEAIPLSREVLPGLVPQIAFAATAANTAYAGTNNGEWGGALYRIALSSGDVEVVRRVDGSDICQGPLNPSCDSITSIIPDPDAPSCVLAGVGLRHFIEHGRVVRVCGMNVSVAWEMPEKKEAQSPALKPARPDLQLDIFFGEAYDTERWTTREGQNEGLGGICEIDPAACPGVDASTRRVDPKSPAVFGLSRTRRGYWMVTGDALYFVQRGRVEHSYLPLLTKRGGVFMGWAPGTLAVATSINQRASISGTTPLLAATSLDDARAGNDLSQYPGLLSLSGASPQETCWFFERDGNDPSSEGKPGSGRALCFDKDRYFARNERGITSGLVRWKRRADGGWVAEISERESIQITVAGEHAVAVYTLSRPRWRGFLKRASGADLDSLRDAIKALPRVEEVCVRALRCHEAASATMHTKREDPEDIEGDYESRTASPPFNAPPHDLRRCQAWLGDVEKEISRRSGQGADDDREPAWAPVCKVR